MKRKGEHVEVGNAARQPAQVGSPVQACGELRRGNVISFASIAALSRQWLFEEEQRKAVLAVRFQ